MCLSTCWHCPMATVMGPWKSCPVSRAVRLAGRSALKPEHSDWSMSGRPVVSGGRRRHRSDRGLARWAVYCVDTVSRVVVAMGAEGPLCLGPTAPGRPCKEGGFADEARVVAVVEETTCVACARRGRAVSAAATMRCGLVERQAFAAQQRGGAAEASVEGGVGRAVDGNGRGHCRWCGCSRQGQGSAVGGECWSGRVMVVARQVK